MAPHVSSAAVRALMDRYPNRHLTANQVFRLAYRASFYGFPGMTPEESDELGQLTGALYKQMSAKDLERFESYQRRLRRDEALPPAEDAEIARLIKGTLATLPEESLRRLQTLFEKAVTLGTLMERSREGCRP
jgi:hypothetical protein